MSFLSTTYLFVFDSHVFRKTVGDLMGTNCAPNLAEYHYVFMKRTIP